MPTISLRVDLSAISHTALTKQADAAKTTVDALATAAVQDLAARAVVEYQQELARAFDLVIATATEEEKLAVLAIVEPIRERAKAKP